MAEPVTPEVLHFRLVDALDRVNPTKLGSYDEAQVRRYNHYLRILRRHQPLFPNVGDPNLDKLLEYINANGRWPQCLHGREPRSILLEMFPYPCDEIKDLCDLFNIDPGQEATDDDG